MANERWLLLARFWNNRPVELFAEDNNNLVEVPLHFVDALRQVGLLVTCSPKTEPGVMRVLWQKRPERTFMKRKRHSPEQIIAMREADVVLTAGASVEQICKQLEIARRRTTSGASNTAG